jgi:hypothetical protein
VFIDGEPQLKGSFTTLKPASSQAAPETPNFDKDAALAIEVITTCTPWIAFADVLL